ncbi:MAG: TIGR02996 domain-containing protein [Fimbriiglobus sp.]|jgi:uncharacterized protein (TIGR02996 family)|nr:TIGR02996 domain-containing protein [Fimbriiglobus sp.]
MDPREPFLKAIIANRQDNLPRLVYADWLEESGEPENIARAHFIRTQIHLEAAVPRTKVYRELKALETRILDYYLDDWRYELPEFVRYGSAVDQVQWRRGFPDDLGPMTFDQFQHHGSGAVETLPLLGVQITNGGAFIHFRRFPVLSHITRLRIGPRFDGLVEGLVWHENGVDTVASNTTESLLLAPVFTSLRHLDLSENQLTDAWLVRFASAFANASFSPTLETLNLSGNFGITDAGANVLATAPGFDRLTKLHLRDTSISRSGWAMLVRRFGERVE